MNKYRLLAFYLKKTVKCLIFGSFLVLSSVGKLNAQQLTILFDDLPSQADVEQVLGYNDFLVKGKFFSKRFPIIIECLAVPEGKPYKVGTYDKSIGLKKLKEIEDPSYHIPKCNVNLESELNSYLKFKGFEKIDYYSNLVSEGLANKVSKSPSKALRTLEKTNLNKFGTNVIFHSLGKAHAELKIENLSSSLDEVLLGETVQVQVDIKTTIAKDNLQYSWLVNGTEIRGAKKDNATLTMEKTNNAIEVRCTDKSTECSVSDTKTVKGIKCQERNMYSLAMDYTQFISYDDHDRIYWIELLDLESAYPGLRKYKLDECYILPIKLGCPTKKFVVQILDENGKELSGSVLKWNGKLSGYLNYADLTIVKSDKPLYLIDDEVYRAITGDELEEDATLLFFSIPFEHRREELTLQILPVDDQTGNIISATYQIAFKQCE